MKPCLVRVAGLVGAAIGATVVGVALVVLMPIALVVGGLREAEDWRIRRSMS